MNVEEQESIQTLKHKELTVPNAKERVVTTKILLKTALLEMKDLIQGKKPNKATTELINKMDEIVKNDTEFWDEKLRALCEGLRMNNIDKLMTGSVSDFRAVGEAMIDRLIKIKGEEFKVPKTLEEMVLVIERAKEIMSKEKDKLTAIRDEIDELVDPTERGFEALEDAIDAFSEQL